MSRFFDELGLILVIGFVLLVFGAGIAAAVLSSDHKKCLESVTHVVNTVNSDGTTGTGSETHCIVQARKLENGKWIVAELR